MKLLLRLVASRLARPQGAAVTPDTALPPTLRPLEATGGARRRVLRGPEARGGLQGGEGDQPEDGTAGGVGVNLKRPGGLLTPSYGGSNLQPAITKIPKLIGILFLKVARCIPSNRDFIP